jgi:hypothetical protein
MTRAEAEAECARQQRAWHALKDEYGPGTAAEMWCSLWSGGDVMMTATMRPSGSDSRGSAAWAKAIAAVNAKFEGKVTPPAPSRHSAWDKAIAAVNARFDGGKMTPPTAARTHPAWDKAIAAVNARF